MKRFLLPEVHVLFFFFKAFIRERSAFGANVCTYVIQRGGQFTTLNREADSNGNVGVKWARSHFEK